MAGAGEEAEAEKVEEHSSPSAGLSLGQKLFGLGVIGGLVFLFVRYHSKAEKWDKTMA